MKNMLRISSAVHRVFPGDAFRSGKYALKAIEEAASVAPDIIVLPALSVSGASCGSLFRNQTLLSNCRDVLLEIAEKTADINAYIIIGLPTAECGKIFGETAVIHSGNILSQIPSFEPPEGLSSANVYSYFSSNPEKNLFECGSIRFSVISCSPKKLPLFASSAVAMGAEVIVNPCAVPITAGETELCRRTALQFSESCGCGVVTCNGNIGESTSPYLYRSFAGIFECGEQLDFQVHDKTYFSSTADIDIDIISSKCYHNSGFFGLKPIGSHILNDKNGLLRDVRSNPYLPSDYTETVSVTADYFELQVRSLTGRMKNAGIKKAVIGCSGGVDSTLAVLVSYAALDRMSLPKKNLIGITMPGFGTSDRTYYNALRLLESLNADSREIPIRASIVQHFEDIKHDPSEYDVVFENSQARERAQILFDVANAENGIVVGAHDLSENALGFSAFVGDSCANFNVNSCVPKSLARSIIRYLSETSLFVNIGEILNDIADTPSSTELIPLDENGEQPQTSEDVVGPFELNDFFLYYFVNYGMPPSKIFEYACAAFESQYTQNIIYETLKNFLTKFFSNQFKRSCMPDSSAIGKVCLETSKYRIPSDASQQFMLSELDDAIGK